MSIVTTKMSQKDYLKKYLAGGSSEGKKKKKKKLKGAENVVRATVKVIDDDVDLSKLQPIDESALDLYELTEDAPQIVGIVDERPAELQVLDQYKQGQRWKVLGGPDGDGVTVSAAGGSQPKGASVISEEEEFTVMTVNQRTNMQRKDIDSTPPRRRKQYESDESPTRGKKILDSPPRKKSQGNSCLSAKRQHDDSDVSPPRRSRNDGSDEYPPRKGKSKDISPLRRRKYSDSDTSPPRKRREKEDLSPPRRRKKSDADTSPPRKMHEKEDMSPPRRRKKSDSDTSPPRKRHEKEDMSPPRRRKKSDSNTSPSKKIHQKEDMSPSRGGKLYDSDTSPPRKRQSEKSSHHKKNRDDDVSPPRKHYNHGEAQEHSRSTVQQEKDTGRRSEKMKTTLDGKVAGLQDADKLKQELLALKKKEEIAFAKMDDSVSGRGAKAIQRDRKTGLQRNLEQEAAEERAKNEKENKNKEKYTRWGKGLKQSEDQQDRLARDLYEMSKPLARYADDKDLDSYLREQDREGDPMLEYLRNKKKEESNSKVPLYQGSFPPNRYNIRPGFRWDGVDRSNGYEKKRFEAMNAKKAVEEEAYKWSTSDM